MVLDKGIFRKVMGQFATGVTIATTLGQEGATGLTVNSFTSVSLDPLLVLICVELHTQSLPVLRESGFFAINILTQEQEQLSNWFAIPSDERYTYLRQGKHSIAATGAPILENTLAFIDARITAEYPGGDHAIFVGQVEAVGYDGQIFFLPGVSSAQCTYPGISSSSNHHGHNGHDAPASKQAPLLYYQGRYHHLSSHYDHEHPELAPAQDAQ